MLKELIVDSHLTVMQVTSFLTSLLATLKVNEPLLIAHGQGAAVGLLQLNSLELSVFLGKCQHNLSHRKKRLDNMSLCGLTD